MKQIQFTTVIEAKPAMVWNVMLAQDTYRTWTSVFTEGSYFKGSWNKGERIRFLAPDGSGMTAVIAENRRHEFLSIKHVGTVKDGVEDIESESVRKWAPAYENYEFVALGEGTELKVTLDVMAEHEKYMLETWPKALEKLKAICESRPAARL